VLSLGNGAFAFNADITGLQTFNATYSNTGTGTFADWGWHISPWNSTAPSYAVDAFVWPYYDTPIDGHGSTRKVPYANSGPSPPAVTDWLMSNPHRANLVQLSLRAWGGGASTAPLQLSQLSAMSQRLDVWTAALESNFSVAPEGPSTCSMTPDNDMALFSCGPGGGVITGVPWASYGQPTGSCAAGFVANPDCDATSSSAVLAGLCVGRPNCRCIVDHEGVGLGHWLIDAHPFCSCLQSAHYFSGRLWRSLPWPCKAPRRQCHVQRRIAPPRRRHRLFRARPRDRANRG
jgi:hypothetical protein